MDCYRLRNSSDIFSDLLVARIVTVVSSASTPCCVVTTSVAMLRVAVPPGRLGSTCVYGAYVGPMLVQVRLLKAMLGPCSGHVRAMLSLCEAKNSVFRLSLYPAQKEHVVFGSCWDHVGRRWSQCWAYVDPC